MKTIRELIDKSWDLVENNQIDGDLLPCLDDCEQEFMDAESKLNKLLICDVMQQRELLLAFTKHMYKQHWFKSKGWLIDEIKEFMESQ